MSTMLLGGRPDGMDIGGTHGLGVQSSLFAVFDGTAEQSEAADFRQRNLRRSQGVFDAGNNVRIGISPLTDPPRNDSPIALGRWNAAQRRDLPSNFLHPVVPLARERA